MLHQISHKLSRLLFILALATCALAQQPAPRATVATEEPSVQNLRAHVGYLASDELEGRRTGSVGAQKAAGYVEAEFKRLGLRAVVDVPASARPARTYLQKFPYVAAVELGQGNALRTVPRAGEKIVSTVPVSDLRVGEDWMPLSFSSNGTVENTPAVFVNYGITSKELNHDDYANLDVKDKIAIALDGTPDGDNPHGQFASLSDPRWKVIAAKDHGAKALILLSQQDKLDDDRLSKLQYDNSGDAGLPVVVLGKPAAYSLLKSIYTPWKGGPCGAGTKMDDGTVVTQCGDIKFIKSLGKPTTVELPDGTKGSVGPDGNFSISGFAGPKEFEKLSWSLSTNVSRREEPAYNVVGVLEGSDAKLKNEVIVVGAHYDHLGRGGAGSLATREGDIHHGADDNASGVATLLELARIFATITPKPRRTVVFVAFSGEEEGLIGSSYYVKSPVVPLANTVAMVNMDMVGRMKDDKLIVGGVGTAAEWRKLVDDANTDMNLRVNVNGVPAAQREAGDIPVVTGSNGSVIATANPKQRFNLTLNEDGYGPSDHSSFYAKQVPVIFLWTGTHEDYHKPTDTADKINYEGLARVAAFTRDLVRAVDDADVRPTYTQAKSDATTGRSISFRVYLGTIPNYAEGGEGLKLDGVREGSPAEKAGLKAGDVIVRLAGRDVKNVYDYTYALGEMKAGEEYEVEALRGGERLKLKIIPAARK